MSTEQLARNTDQTPQMEFVAEAKNSTKKVDINVLLDKVRAEKKKEKIIRLGKKVNMIESQIQMLKSEITVLKNFQKDVIRAKALVPAKKVAKPKKKKTKKKSDVEKALGKLGIKL